MALDANGWTILPTVQSPARNIYVSQSGSDSNDGLSDSTPKRNISTAINMLRSGYGDWLLLKCGDTFAAEGSWRINTSGGPSADAMSGIGSYGTGARPLLLNGSIWYGSSSTPLKNFAIVGIEQYASFLDPQSPDFGGGAAGFALRVLVSSVAATQMENVLIEGCRWRNFTTNVQFSSESGSNMPGVTIRRNVFMYGGEFGLQIYYTQGALVEENVFYKNGWAERTVQLHNMYMSGATTPTIKNNVFSHGGNMSIKLSGNYQHDVTDFTVEGNVFNRGMLGMGHGALNGSWDPLTQYSHERGIVRNNVMMKVGKNLPYNSASVQAIGLNIGNLDDVLFEGNIFAHNDEYLAEGQIFRFADPAVERSANITARNNVVWNWLSTQFNATGKYMVNEGSVTNFVQDNNLPTDVTYTNPNATLATYHASIGGEADEDAYMLAACEQQKSSWDDRYMAQPFVSYMQAAFAPAGGGGPSTHTMWIPFGGSLLMLRFSVSQGA